MDWHDDDLQQFALQGAVPLPEPGDTGMLAHAGAQIWYAQYGAGFPLVLLHGGLGNSGNWGYQVPALIQAGYRVVLIDTRGHGRSTRDDQPYSYRLLASDLVAVLDLLQLDRAVLAGWSDGACTALITADQHPERVAGGFFFACNMDPSGTKEFEFTPVVGRCFERHRAEYQQLSATPDQFDALVAAVSQMQQSEPNYSAADLGQIHVPVAIVQGEHDQFIKPEHARYLAASIPAAELIELPGVSHFAPLQRPQRFTDPLLQFAGRVSAHPGRVVAAALPDARPPR
ncbi:MAG: alpha/beta hydrolase [Roseiflexaceae bacterium]